MEKDIRHQKQRRKAECKDINAFVHRYITLPDKVQRDKQQNATGTIDNGVQFW
jgi:hypothetical protein